MARKYLISGLLITILLVATIVANRSGANPLYSPENLTPTVIPPELLTQAAQISTYQAATETAYSLFATQFAQTEQALQLTFAAAPTTDFQRAYPMFNNMPPRPEELLGNKQSLTLVGYGVLYQIDRATDTSQKYVFNGLLWEQQTHDTAV